MTKKTLLLSILLTFGLFAFAQESNGYYFKEFTQGQVILKNKQFARGKFNYDFVNHQMHFLNGTTDMIVENLPDIDTIIIDKTRFVPYEGRFMEVLQGKKAVVLLEKEVNTRERGKVGAMGVATHGSVQAIDVNTRFQRVNGDNNTDLTIYKNEIENTYFTYIKRKWEPFRNQATFLKLFPKKKQENIKEIIKKLDVDFENPEDVVKLLDQIE
ncbi:MAG: hypothetical protein IJE78_09100 [Bacteroidaceae bacterium]|nr:hypothetical protein [Bacteroidaceae bacterium]